MSEITREYLEYIGFNIEYAKKYEPNKAFTWIRMTEGWEYWDKQQDGVTSEGNAKIDEMIRVWEATEPQPEPAIEYVITAGPGRMIDLGVTTEEMVFYPIDVEVFIETKIAPTTTSCMTGK